MQMNDDPEPTATASTDRNQSNQEEKGETEDLRQQPESNAFLEKMIHFLMKMTLKSSYKMKRTQHQRVI
jgi:hypothetical protein